jgi:hypothetical protein
MNAKPDSPQYRNRVKSLNLAADFRSRKERMRELQLKTMSDELLTVEVEEGAPLMGVWNALLNLCARNRRSVSNQ